MNIAFPHNLVEKRKERGWSQQQIADKLKKKRSTYAAWEKNRGIPNLIDLIVLCEIYQIDDLYLFLTKEIFTPNSLLK